VVGRFELRCRFRPPGCGVAKLDGPSCRDRTRCTHLAAAVQLVTDPALRTGESRHPAPGQPAGFRGRNRLPRDSVSKSMRNHRGLPGAARYVWMDSTTIMCATTRPWPPGSGTAAVDRSPARCRRSRSGTCRPSRTWRRPQRGEMVRRIDREIEGQMVAAGHRRPGSARTADRRMVAGHQAGNASCGPAIRAPDHGEPARRATAGLADDEGHDRRRAAGHRHRRRPC